MAIDKNAVIKEAQKFAAKGQFDKAIAEWKKLIRVSPNDANLYNTIGDLCLKKDAKAEAVDAYKKAADLLAADGFTSKAIALYKKILNIDPKKVEVHLSLGDLNAEKGLTGNALESYKLAADHYIKNNKMADALRIYQKMADLNPSNINFRLKLADMYAKEGLKSDSAKTYLEAADIHITNSAFQDARQLFEKVLALDPNNKQVYHKAGIVYFKEEKFTEACKALKPAFDADPKNQELTDVYLESLSKAGRSAEAEEILKKLLSQEPGRVELREKLYHLYLSRKDYDGALTEASSLADNKMENREFDAAEEILKGFLAESPNSIPGLRRLSDFYVNLRRNEDAARLLLRAAELLISSSDTNGARESLNRAIELAPYFTEARQRLESLETLAAAPPVEEMPIQEPAPLAPEQPAAAFEEVPPAAPSAVEEDPAITEAFTEVDVLIKYGLAGKAVERLESLTGRFPSSPLLRTRLRDLYREQGNTKKAVEHALALADIFAQRGAQNQAESELRAALDMDPRNSEIMSRLGTEPEEAPAAMPEEMVFQEPTLEAPIFEAAPESAAPPIEAPTVEWQPPVSEELGEPFAPAPEQEAPIHEPLAAEADISEIWAEAEFYYQQGLFDEARKYYEKIIERSPSDRRAIERLSEISREKEELQEFVKLTEAVEGLESLVPEGTAEGETTPSTSDEEAVRSLMQDIEDLKQRQKAEPAHPAPEGVVLPEMEKVPPPSMQETAAGRAGEGFFDLGRELREEGGASPFTEKKEGGEEFFDLAAELREELGSVTLPERPAETVEDQSLDDIFEEFKKGIEEQAGKEDIDTHYNLGIAYKEMGLLDDAINEFMTTPEGEPKFIESRYMLGLCFMEKGDYHNAIVEIQNALNFSESLGGDAQERIGMRYDLGLAYQGAGNINEAMIEFQTVADADPGYRDVAAKLQELRQGEFISLDQLKEDIEKEISAKFLEEGERIEREEKNKKNEKVRG